jgi:DNA polymerase III subunit alpha
MAAVLSRNLSDIKKITTFMDECRRMGIQVLGPDVNESQYKFSVMPNGDIRFGLGAIKGMGENAVANIIETRANSGKFKDVYDFMERLNLQTVNKKNLEVLVLAGAFNNLSPNSRSTYFTPDPRGGTYLETLMRWGIKAQTEKQSNQMSLFGTTGGFDMPKPEAPKVDEWPTIELLNREKEVVGIYLSAHPLDEFRFEIENLCNVTLADLKSIDQYRDRDVTIAGMVIGAKIDTTKNGKPYARLTLEDYSDSMEIMLFGKDFETYRNFCYTGYMIMIKGKVQPKTYKPEELELRIRTMSMLYDVREQQIKGITITLPLTDITDIVIDDFVNLSSKEKAKVLLRFKIVDPENRISVDLFSRSYKVNITNEFVNYLKDNEMDFKLIAD